MIIAIVVSGGFRIYFTLASEGECSDPDENNFFKEIAEIVNDRIYSGNIS